MMNPSMNPCVPAELVIAESFSPLLRLLLGAAGLGAGWLILADLGPGIWAFGWHALLFGSLALCGIGIGGSFVFAAFFGQAVTIAVQDGSAVIERATPFSVQREILSRGVVRTARAVANQWDSKAGTWRIEISFADGRTLLTPDLGSKAEAETAALLIEHRLGQVSPV